MFEKLQEQEGKYLQLMLRVNDENGKLNKVLLHFSEKPMDLENEENSFTSSMFELLDFFVFSKNCELTVEKYFLSEEENFYVDYSLLAAGILFERIKSTEKLDDLLIIETEKGKAISIDLETLQIHEEKKDIRILKGFILDSVDEITWDDIKVNGTSMMAKAMSPIISQSVKFPNLPTDDDIFEGDIIRLTFENNTKKEGMLMYNFNTHQYVLKTSSGEYPLNGGYNKVKKIKLLQTFFDAQVASNGQIMSYYFTEEELRAIFNVLYDYQSISLGIKGLLSLINKDSYTSNEYYEILFNNGLSPDVINGYFHEMLEKEPVTLFKEIPYVAFLLPYGGNN